jgi:hypothetical protein
MHRVSEAIKNFHLRPTSFNYRGGLPIILSMRLRWNGLPEGLATMTPDPSMRWQATDEVLDEAGACGLPAHRRIWLAIARRDPLRTHRLNIIALDAALSATKDYLLQMNATASLAKLAYIEDLAGRQIADLQGGPGITLPWAEIDELRRDIGLEPTLKPNNKR